jgi:tetratricopeptide (TPR) repeat protein
LPGIDPAWHVEAFVRAYSERRWFASLFHLRRLPADWPLTDADRSLRADTFAELGRWDEAIDEFGRLAQKKGQEHDWTPLALAQLAAGRTKDYRDTCRRALLREFEVAWAGTAAQALLSKGNPLGATAAMHLRLGSVVPMNVAPWALDPGPDAPTELALARAWPGLPLGTALYRAGRHREALAQMAGDRIFDRDPAARLWRALVERGAGEETKATQTYREAIAALEKPASANARQSVYQRLNWKDRVAVDHLRREFERGAKKAP